ncbi:MAG: Lysine exporter protein (LYSE/YGGA) [Candidatus Falkowbacteria bacterium GW2011_GWF2_39_8]|uniref:Lysine exporter protein (LYSE/YGGA) n=1 Tax=Candidatus Falkowbacteria bacterium GW2011_GWF2_39_8 TaxID=1618642 RepID=A0A0G0Q523_9BACT|nr:MAG: Lysine exporter protein (LYSE/YGGA) [Candidatus Falkowbacteria bacterium GW2011_GWF2_39_8]
MTNEILSAFILGLIGGLIPGPVLAATFTEILQFGMLKSFRIILWAMLTETIIALLSLLALTSMNLTENFFQGLSIIGAAILIWISFSIWKINKIDMEEKVHFGLGKISAMILANGVLWTFWITVCVPKAIMLSEKIYLGNYLFLLLVEIGWLISTVSVAFIFSRFRTILSNPKVVPIIFKIFALTFVYFAIDMVYKSVKYFVV